MSKNLSNAAQGLVIISSPFRSLSKLLYEPKNLRESVKTVATTSHHKQQCKEEPSVSFGSNIF